MNHLPKEELAHGFYYKGRCRNATVARWNGEEEQFYHWRTKFNYTYIETIKCPEDENFFDVFYATEWIDPPEKEIPFK
jgi:hypothetical protein